MRKKKQKTWTFQPDEDVYRLINDVLGKNPKHGEKTRLINLAIRTHLKVAAEIVKQQSEIEARSIAAVVAVATSVGGSCPQESIQRGKRVNKSVNAPVKTS